MAPQYHGVDPILQEYYDLYVKLAANRGIKFSNKVTAGFTNLDDGDNVVGMCSINGIMGFREVDIDIPYWKTASDEQRMTEVFHELTHCLCGRDHDFGPGIMYPDPDTPAVYTAIKDVCVDKIQPKGLYDDECPISIMYPKIVYTYCMDAHYKDYIKEMFDRCDPW